MTVLGTCSECNGAVVTHGYGQDAYCEGCGAKPEEAHGPATQAISSEKNRRPADFTVSYGWLNFVSMIPLLPMLEWREGAQYAKHLFQKLHRRFRIAIERHNLNMRRVNHVSVALQ